ncbi:MAG: TonB-dependent receptor [Acidobacteria bacterium]|nr:TonB-dependent receptor [Acidobacteriota bacterium]
MKMLHMIKTSISVLGLSIALVSALAAQNRATGEIRGVITDPSGSPVTGVMVELVNTSTQVTKQVPSNDAGIYVLPFLPPGTYTLAFEGRGFKKFVRSGIALGAGEVVRADAKMEIGEVTETVKVTDSAPPLATETSDRKVLSLKSEVVTELPLVGRAALSFQALAPGANYGPFRAFGGAPLASFTGFNGQRTFMTNMSLDGGLGTSSQGWSNNHEPPLEAIGEVTLITSNFSAEFGNGLSVYSLTTKSGTNQWHGSLFEFVQNDVFSARNFFAKKKPPLRINQFGGTVGGPILRDKAFFFFSYQGLRQVSPSTLFMTVPSPQMLQGDFSAPGLPVIYDPDTNPRQPFTGNIIPKNRLDPVSSAIAKFWPQPNLPGLGNNFTKNGGSRNSSNIYNVKVDYNLSSAHRIAVSYRDGSRAIVFPNNFPSGICPAGQSCDSLELSNPQTTVAHTWTLSPTKLNEFRFSFLRDTAPWAPGTLGKGFPAQLGLKNPGSDTFPNISIGGAISTGFTQGSGGGSFSARYNDWAASNVFTWVKGNHILKLGGEFDRHQTNVAQPWYQAGSFSFSGIFTRNPSISGSGLGLADFLLGLPETYSLFIGPNHGQRSWSAQSFVQDDVKVTPNLTLNLGLRHEIRSGWSEAHNRLSNFDPNLINPATNTPGAIWFAGQQGRTALMDTKYLLFSPVVGFAWSPGGGKFAIRAGYGLQYVPWNAGIFSNQGPAGFATQNFRTASDLFTPIFRMADGPPPVPLPDPSRRTPDIVNGQAINYWPVNPPVGYSQQWQLSIQRQLRGDILLDVAYVGTKGTNLAFPRDINQVPENLLGPGNAQPRRPFPQYQAINARLFDAISNYHSLQVSVNKRMSAGLFFLASYTLSKTLDNNSFTANWGFGGDWQISAKPRSSYSLSLMDVPQRVSGALVYQIPSGWGKRYLNRGGLVDAVLGGWQVSGIFIAESGVPFSVTTAGPNLSGSLAGAWFPNRLANGALSNPTISRWFDASAFAPAAPFTFGNSGRNILRGPGFWNLDFGLAKSFRLKPLGEKAFFQIRMDAFDIFNHPNFGLPVAAIGSPNVGQIFSSTTTRNIQLGGRIVF